MDQLAQDADPDGPAVTSRRASACPAAVTETTSASRIAATPFTGIATSVLKLPVAEVRGRGPADASSSASSPCDARMRP